MVAYVFPRRSPPLPPTTYMAISSIFSRWQDKIRESVYTDGKLKGIIDALKDGSTIGSKYSMVNGSLMKQGRLVVGDDKILKQNLITFFHSSVFEGHSGVHATTQRLSNAVY